MNEKPHNWSPSTTQNQVENLDAFQNLDACRDWEGHDPRFEWTEEDLREAEEERQALSTPGVLYVREDILGEE